MFTHEEIVKVIPGSQLATDNLSRLAEQLTTCQVNGISIDTRTIKPGELFIPLKGPNFDGHDFISQALKKGALVLAVKDGLKALQDLAAYHRSKFKIPIIGVTGSVGKTTTKDMIASILEQEMNVLKNEENLNNEIGVPLTLLKLTKEHKAAVIEMGMQGLKEIELLARIARPTIAVVTNIGEAHLEFLKTKKNIAKAKAEIFKYLRPEDIAVINQDDEYFEHLKLKVKRQKAKVMSFGIIEKADITPNDLVGIKLPIPGEHNVYNALAAIAVAKIKKLKPTSIKKGLESFLPSSKRMELITLRNGIEVINDTYNANPQSVAAALRVLSQESGVGRRKIAVLGDMLELGKTARSAHKKIITLANKLKINKVFTFGQLWPYSEKDKKQLIKKVRGYVRPHDIILVKGSRSMKMEEVVEALIH